VFWTLVGLAFAGQLYLSRANVGAPVTWQFALGRALADWYVFALLSLPAFWLAQRFHFDRATWGGHLMIHVPASVVFSLAWMLVRAAVEQWHGWSGGNRVDFREAFSHALVATFSFNLLVYWAIVAVAHAFDYYRKFNEHELRTAELENRLTQSRLQALQMQLNPHFLFNTLNAIASLMHKDVDAADRMIARLGELLRYALESTEAHEVPLQQELDFLRRYLEIEQTRFGDRLVVRMEIAPETLDARVPNLLLQPLVENAIAYGVAPHSRLGTIVLSSRRDNEILELQVRDNGNGLPPDGKFREGIGLSNTRARLQQLYGAGHQFDLEKAPEGGLAVKIVIPWRTKEKADV
jgi:signal transduction histidine kinase